MCMRSTKHIEMKPIGISSINLNWNGNEQRMHICSNIQMSKLYSLKKDLFISVNKVYVVHTGAFKWCSRVFDTCPCLYFHSAFNLRTFHIQIRPHHTHTHFKYILLVIYGSMKLVRKLMATTTTTVYYLMAAENFG